MTDDVSGRAPAQPARTPAPTSPVSPAHAPPRPSARRAKPASRLELFGWSVLLLGVLVLVYFALTRSL